MTRQELRQQKKQLQLERQRLYIDTLARALNATKDVALALVAAPAFQLVGSFVAIEYLQTVKIWKGDYETITGGDPNRALYPGEQITRKKVEPLISQTLANLMETSIGAGISIGGLGVGDFIMGLIKK